MDDDSFDRLRGQITATNHLLEHTWVMLLQSANDPHAIRTVRRHVMQDFALLPAGDPSDESQRIAGHAIANLEEFWDRVAVRLSR